jgi:Right handed beta helix region
MHNRIAALVSFRALLAALVSASAVVALGLSWPSGERRAHSESRVGGALPRLLSPSTGRTFRAHSEARVGRALPRLLSASTGRTFYVSKSGSDSSRGTFSAPWRTVQKALDTMRPGQRALVRSGIYREDLLMTRSGRASKPITLAAYPGARVALRPASTTGDTYPIVIFSAAYFRLHGFVIEGSVGTSSANVYVSGSSHHIEISRNEIRHGQDSGVFTERTTSYLLLLGNRVHDNGRRLSGQHHGLYIQGVHDLIANNVIYNHLYGFGLQIWPVNHHTVVVNNTIAASGLSSIVLGAGEPGDVSDVIIRNNILYGGNWGIELYNDCPRRSHADHNLIYAYREAPLTGRCEQGLDTSEDNILAGPRFTGYRERDFHLRATSPALNVALRDWSARNDAEGRRRPQGPGPDVGAFERPLRAGR